MMQSSEFVIGQETRWQISFIAQLYRLLLDRNPDPSGLHAFVHALHCGKTPADVVQAILAADEFQSRKRAGLTDPVLGILERHAAVFPEAERAARLERSIAAYCAQLAKASPVDVTPLLASRDFNDAAIYRWWIDDYETPHAARCGAAALPGDVRFSLFVTIGAEAAALIETVTSIQQQSYRALEIVILTGGCEQADTYAIADRLSADDARVCHQRAYPDETPVQQLSRAWQACQGDGVGQVHCGDRLAQSAIAEIAAVWSAAAYDVVFTDDDVIGMDGLRGAPRFWGAWDPDRILAGSAPAFVVYRRAVIDGLDGWHDLGEGMTWHDLLLRAAVTVPRDRTGHVPLVLYHRRAEAAPPPLTSNEPWCDLVRRAIGQSGRVTSGMAPGMARIIHPLPDPPPLVSILIPTVGRENLLRPCLESIRDNTVYPNIEVLVIINTMLDLTVEAWFAAVSVGWAVRIVRYDGHFNWGRVNNIGAAAAAGTVLVLLNDDTVVLHDDWLNELVGQALRPDVGAVGARLLYPDGRIQHAGMTISPDGVGYHVMRYADPQAASYLDQLQLVREVSAVTGACIAVEAAIFHLAGGIEEAMLQITHSDTDFCMRVSALGYRVIWTPYACLTHAELATRGADDTPEKLRRATEERLYFRWFWSDRLTGDPFWSPSLAFSETVELAAPPTWLVREVQSLIAPAPA